MQGTTRDLKIDKTVPILKTLTDLVEKHKHTNNHIVRENEISSVKVTKYREGSWEGRVDNGKGKIREESL